MTRCNFLQTFLKRLFQQDRGKGKTCLGKDSLRGVCIYVYIYQYISYIYTYRVIVTFCFCIKSFKSFHPSWHFFSWSLRKLWPRTTLEVHHTEVLLRWLSIIDPASCAWKWIPEPRSFQISNLRSLLKMCIPNQFRSAPCKVLQIFDKHVPMFCAWCASCLASCYKASHSKGRLNHPPPQYSAGTCSDSSPYHGDEKHSVQLLLSHSRIIIHHVQICVNVHSQFMWNHCQFQTWKRVKT